MADYTGSNGNDLFFFDGQMQHLTGDYTNAYTGETISIDDDYNVNTASYEGLAGIDTLYMTNIGDALFLTDNTGVQLLHNIEQVIAGEGGDLIMLDSNTITLGDMLIDGGAGDDIIWANAGNDTLRGLDGNDVMNGGGGNDNLMGMNGNDTLNGGAGADFLRGDAGDDTLVYAVDGVWAAGTATINAYTGDMAGIDGMNRSFDTFNGGTGNDTLNMTAGNDALVLDDPVSPRHPASAGARAVDVETINAGAGDDVVNLTSTNYAVGNVTINGGDGQDVLWSGAGNDVVNGDAGDDVLHGGAGNDYLQASDGNDTILGGDGDDTLIGQAGNDRLEGGAGDDILYGGDMAAPVYYDHTFSNDVVFPTLVERDNLDADETGSLGVAQGDLSVAYSTTGTVTFVESGAGYKNTLGVYNIAADGTMQSVEIAFAQVKNSYAGQTFDVHLPGAPDSDFGFFIIADGYSVNDAYAGLDLSAGNLQFLYKAGTADERAAKVTDSAADISLVYDDGTTHTVLSGPIYHTTERGGSLALNPDGQEHVVSGLVQVDLDHHDIHFSKDVFKSGISSYSDDGITIHAATGQFTFQGNDSNAKIGIKSDGAMDTKINESESLEIRFDHDANQARIELFNVAQDSAHPVGVDLKVYLDNDFSHAVTLELDTGNGVYVDGNFVIKLSAQDLGGTLISGVDVASVANSALGTTSFWLSGVETTLAAPPDDSVLRLGFEDLPCLGDADYNDVVFDLTINAQTVSSVQPGDDILIGGAGNDILYGSGGADEFVFTEKDGSFDTIMDFRMGDHDRLNITDILENYSPVDSAIGDFVRLTQQGADTVLEVNNDGQGTDFAAVAIIAGGLGGATLADLINNGQLVTDHSQTMA